MQIIGTRASSTFRVDADWYAKKKRFACGVDPTTGGPVEVVQDFTDTKVNYHLDCDPTSPTFRQVVANSKSIEAV